MRTTIALAVILAAGGAAADECDVLVARVVERTGAAFVRRVDDTAQLRHPLTKSLTARCAGRRSSVDAFVDSAYPPPAFFDLLALAAGATVEATEVEIRKAALRCQRLALRSKDGRAFFDLRRFQMNCGETPKPSPGTSDFSVFGR